MRSQRDKEGETNVVVDRVSSNYLRHEMNTKENNIIKEDCISCSESVVQSFYLLIHKQR